MAYLTTFYSGVQAKKGYDGIGLQQAGLTKTNSWDAVVDTMISYA